MGGSSFLSKKHFLWEKRWCVQVTVFCCLGSSMFASTLGGEKKNELMKFSRTLDATHLAPTVVLLLQLYLLTCNTKALFLAL